MENIIIFAVSMTTATVIDGLKNSLESDKYKIVGLLDDDESKKGKEYFGYKVLGGFNDLESLVLEHNITCFLTGLADHRHMLLRDRVYKKALSAGLKPCNSIHAKSIVVASAKAGLGAFIMPNVYIGIDTVIGVNCSIHAGVSILEACKFGNNVMIAGNSFVGGYAVIGNNVYIGPGSIIGSGVEIGDNCLIGAGALVLKNVPSNTAAFGHPINIMKENAYFI